MRYSTVVNFLIPRIKKNNKIKVIKFLNLIIFVSIFALISSSMSLFFENKIDKIEKRVTLLEVNNLIFTNQLERTSKNIKLTENLILDIIENNSLLEILNEFTSDQSAFSSKRDLYFEPYYLLQSLAVKNNDEISRVTKDAMLIVEDLNELNLVEKAIDEAKFIENKFNNLNRRESLYEAKKPDQNPSTKELNKYYEKYQQFNEEYKDLLDDQKKFFFEFSYLFFSKKREEYTEEINKNLEEISKLSKNETKTILYAFLIQIIIFLVIQSFEISFEIFRKKK
jgi:hypothetical protein